METNNEKQTNKEEKVIQYEDLLKYTDEEAYKVLLEDSLKVPYQNFVRRSDEEVANLLTKENILDLIDLVATLGQMHHSPMIRISKAVASIILHVNSEELSEPQAKAFARYYYEDKKRRTNSKIDMVFEERDEEETDFNFGEYLNGFTEDGESAEAIFIYIDNILDGTSNKQQAIFEILNTINHEFYHAIEAKKRTKTNVYDHYTLQGALDTVIINSNMKYHGKDYYSFNYIDIVEENRAEIYGMTRTLDMLKQVKTDQYDQYIKYAERKIVQLEMQKNVNINYQEEIVKNRFEVANQMATEIVKEDPEILNENKLLTHVINADGTRKTVTQLIRDKMTAEQDELKRLMEVEKLMQEKGSKKYEKRYREIRYNYNKIDLYYSELIYYAFKSMEYDEFKDLFNNEESTNQLEKALNLVLKNRETRLLENNTMYLHKLLKLSTWKRQLENLKRHVEKAKRAVQKFDHLNERALHDDEITKIR